MGRALGRICAPMQGSALKPGNALDCFGDAPSSGMRSFECDALMLELLLSLRVRPPRSPFAPTGVLASQSRARGAPDKVRLMNHVE